MWIKVNRAVMVTVGGRARQLTAGQVVDLSDDAANQAIRKMCATRIAPPEKPRKTKAQPDPAPAPAPILAESGEGAVEPGAEGGGEAETLSLVDADPATPSTT